MYLFVFIEAISWKYKHQSKPNMGHKLPKLYFYFEDITRQLKTNTTVVIIVQDPDGSKCKQEEEGKKEVAMSLSFEFRFCLLKNKREIKKWDVRDSGANYKIRV